MIQHPQREQRCPNFHTVHHWSHHTRLPTGDTRLHHWDPDFPQQSLPKYTGHKESKIGFDALPVEFIHVVAQVKLQIFCVFKLTCGKGPCWNQGHWSGDLWFQESLSIDQCPQDNMSCPKTSHNRVSMTIDQLKNSMNACSRNTGERHTFRGSQERSFSLSNG